MAEIGTIFRFDVLAEIIVPHLHDRQLKEATVKICIQSVAWGHGSVGMDKLKQAFLDTILHYNSQCSIQFLKFSAKSISADASKLFDSSWKNSRTIPNDWKQNQQRQRESHQIDTAEIWQQSMRPIRNKWK